MILICPKCGDYYAGGSSAFCVADGTPLVNVEPTSAKWTEGLRVTNERGEALRKKKRRLKWRRVLVMSTTMMIVTLVVCVVAVNAVLYFKPVTKGGASGITPTPTPTPTSTPTSTPTLTPTPQCSDADQARAAQSLRRLEPRWRQDISGERARIISEAFPDNSKNAEANLGLIEFQYRFPKPCKAAVVTARYAWQVSYSSPVVPRQAKSVSKRRTIRCSRFQGAWGCH